MYHPQSSARKAAILCNDNPLKRLIQLMDDPKTLPKLRKAALKMKKARRRK